MYIAKDDPNLSAELTRIKNIARVLEAPLPSTHSAAVISKFMKGRKGDIFLPVSPFFSRRRVKQS